MMRVVRYLRRPDVRRDPLRLIARRLLVELERRYAPGRFRRERIVPIDDRVVMSLRADDEIERAIYVFGLYEYVSAQAFLRLIRNRMTVVDAGAHSGQYTLLAAVQAGPEGLVVAVEPNPDVRRRLERNVRLNGLDNVRILASALSREAGRSTLALPAGQNTGIAAVREPRASERSIDVETVALDDLLGSTRLDVLKLDVEGMETEVLAGAHRTLERDHPAILFEANDLYFGDESTDPTVGALRDLGYELYEPATLRRLAPGEDPRLHREYWQSLNLVALHPERAGEFLGD